jgi:hypothetical protein
MMFTGSGSDAEYIARRIASPKAMSSMRGLIV